MKVVRLLVFTVFIICGITTAKAQHSVLKVEVFTENGMPISNVIIRLEGKLTGQYSTDSNGIAEIPKLPMGEYKMDLDHVGLESITHSFSIRSGNPQPLSFYMKSSRNELNPTVITATKTEKLKSLSAVSVQVLDAKMLETVQACNMSEALNFQPGLRVETDCQTCNYSQLRMNGLAGGYSQILINGRPIFSALMGLYGLEQLPTNMVDRIEIIRGGGSALFGSSAIGGTVNIITKLPATNDYQIGYSSYYFNPNTGYNQLNGNTSVVSKNKKSGISLFINRRDRDMLDVNGDNFSELPELTSHALGATYFYRPTKNQKLEISTSAITEYRYGGEMINGPAHSAQQSEERMHQIFMLSGDYQYNFKNKKSSIISYLGYQSTIREHYTGIAPDSAEEYAIFLANLPYGFSENKTIQSGIQFNHKFDSGIIGTNVITIGSEYNYDDVSDQIEAYQYAVNQVTKAWGCFLQSDWEITKKWTLLSGVRYDIHNLLLKPALNPRVSLMFTPRKKTQIRLTYAQGFRAPQAFDTDLHIAFAGGGVSRVSLDPDLRPERSSSYTLSINKDVYKKKYVFGFTLDGFITTLTDVFYLNPVGTDAFGIQYVKQNGTGATVQGSTLELRANYDGKLQLEAGGTYQKSYYHEAIEVAEQLAPRKNFLRTPNAYGFATLSFENKKHWKAMINAVYTGPMDVLHLSGSNSQLTDEVIVSQKFVEWNAKLTYLVKSKKISNQLEIYTGVKNAFNSYQSDFDSGKNRDSNFIYGPALPRVLYFGITIKK